MAYYFFFFRRFWVKEPCPSENCQVKTCVTSNRSTRTGSPEGLLSAQRRSRKRGQEEIHRDVVGRGIHRDVVSLDIHRDVFGRGKHRGVVGKDIRRGVDGNGIRRGVVGEGIHRSVVDKDTPRCRQ